MNSILKSILGFYYKVSPCSQAGQDLFALEIFGKKGTYIDIGAGQPKIDNNTYLLEVKNEWRGFCVDYNQKVKHLWEKDTKRNNKIYWQDATQFDYRKAVEDNNLPINIDFLSCDIDPQEKTFAALKKVINDGIEPKLIAFETDKYRESIDYEKLAYDFLFTKNYKIAVYDVYSELKKKKIYETWFISNEVNFDKTSYSQWVKKFNFL
jgi:hypothetical protein